MMKVMMVVMMMVVMMMMVMMNWSRPNRGSDSKSFLWRNSFR